MRGGCGRGKCGRGVFVRRAWVRGECTRGKRGRQPSRRTGQVEPAEGRGRFCVLCSVFYPLGLRVDEPRFEGYNTLKRKPFYEDWFSEDIFGNRGPDAVKKVI